MVRYKYYAFFILYLSGNASATDETNNTLSQDTQNLEAVKSEALVQEAVNSSDVPKSEALVGNFRYNVDDNFFEDDLVLLPQQRRMMFEKTRLHKKEITYEMYQWPKNYEGFVIVPYWISRFSGFSESICLHLYQIFKAKPFKAAAQLSLIGRAMETIESETCIRFRVRQYENDYLNIHVGKFCKSNLGRTGGAQEMTFNTARCFRKGHVMHELLHALGYIHMHNRPDRDNYIKIFLNNVHPKFIREFDKVNSGLFNYYGTHYDYHSVMHYDSKAASKNGGRTILTRDSHFLNTIGQRVALSLGDARRINVKYNCKMSKRSVEESLEKENDPEEDNDDDEDYFY